ncbi:hypothetical protein HDA32_000756 [Spinactinospora alkalitolerans]|uniref:Conjugal transfer protein n=1 Tax=Spinactinospora alkalitolerans TaxID=687207 RepID=A0A852TMV0_9ACTN|nr:conjugal transfer protein [Spinactinospora alkalitolerans]NYE45636.1 hypothetical protein [Spinactinospora alkalitolerans]
MARKSTARRGGAPTEGTAAPADAWGSGAAEGGGRSRRPRAGSGGRWWIWIGRAVLWAFILVVIFNGVWMPFRSGMAQPTEEEPAETDEVSFPQTSAAAFSLRFAEAYLNADQQQAQERAETLAEFLPEGRATSFNLTGGELVGENIEVLAVDVKDDNNAVVRLSADVNGNPMSLDVPVYADAAGTALVVSGQPALLAAPGKAELPESPGVQGDSDARDELEPILAGFFEAYAQTPEHLSRYLEPGAEVNALPADTVAFVDLHDVTVPAAASSGDDARQAQATVVWRLPGGDGENSAELNQSYLLTVVKDGTSWYVRDIQGAPNSFG